jgi:hypothetical protein
MDLPEHVIDFFGDGILEIDENRRNATKAISAMVLEGFGQR